MATSVFILRKQDKSKLQILLKPAKTYKIFYNMKKSDDVMYLQYVYLLDLHSKLLQFNFINYEKYTYEKSSVFVRPYGHPSRQTT